jgi:hypothetical protein
MIKQEHEMTCSKSKNLQLQEHFLTMESPTKAIKENLNAKSIMKQMCTCTNKHTNLYAQEFAFVSSKDNKKSLRPNNE